MAKKSEPKRPTYAESIAEVEQILSRLRDNTTGIDELAAEVKRATELIAFCKAQLYDVEAAVKAQLDTEQKS